MRYAWTSGRGRRGLGVWWRPGTWGGGSRQLFSWNGYNFSTRLPPSKLVKRWQLLTLASLIPEITFFTLHTISEIIQLGQSSRSKKLSRLFVSHFWTKIRSDNCFEIVSSARNENLRPLLNSNIPLINGKYGLRNHFSPLESFQIEFSSRNGREISDSVFWND